jgi:hypothetical protein
MKRLVRTPSTRVGISIGAPIVAARGGLEVLATQARAEVQLLVNRARRLVGP